LTWGGLATSWIAGKLIGKGESFAILIAGDAADALRKLVGPSAQLSREMLSTVAGNLSLTTLPALMLYSLGRGYELHNESVEGGSVRMRFVKRGAEAAPNAKPEGESRQERGGST
jgi:hypothetical protein